MSKNSKNAFEQTNVKADATGTVRVLSDEDMEQVTGGMSVSQPRPIMCDKCKIVFATIEEYQQHILNHSKH